ncbi:hypothetical protein [Ramlibacter sp.]|uniref:hypothetical protein n=1 Tax=Ramlibacter sp. TaxID=1917967 RepID=UPI003D140ECD
MNRALFEGLTDAIGFVGGALLAFFVARTIGADPFANAAGTGTSSVVGILMCGLGGGVGLHGARFWRRSREKRRDEEA